MFFLHWKQVGFSPDTRTTNEDDIDLDVDVQIGRDNFKDVVKSGPDLTQRYSAIMISGFRADQELTDIHQLMIEQGLPDSVECTDIAKNEKSGKLTIENLGPAVCLAMMENMHGKNFLGRKVFLTPIVSASPEKASATSSSSSDTPIPPEPPSFSSIPSINLKLRTTRNLRPATTKFSLVPVVIVEPPEDIPDLASSSVSDSDSDSDSELPPVSPGIQEKIDQLRKYSLSEKRKAIDSPDKTETDMLSKTEIKMLKKERKRLKKQNYKEAERLKNSGP